VLLLKYERALVVSLYLFLTEPDLDSNCLCSLRGPSGLSNIGLSVKWLWRFFVESLSRPYMIKMVEQIKMGTCTCIQSRDVFFLLWFHSLCFYQRGLDCIWRHMCGSC
jgi:hypothetical protein